MPLRRSLKTTETPKIRRCVVRIKKMKTQPVKFTRSAAKGPAPLKKRPVAGARLSMSLPLKAKERLQKPVVQQRSPKETPPKKAATIVAQLPPTIAAGRSRRAVKPNPKYASEDMVTPKHLKPGKTEGKQRKASASSSDDFFNKASSDDEFDEKRPSVVQSKTQSVAKRNASDSDFIEGVDDNDTPSRRTRGRPAKSSPEVMPRRSVPNSTFAISTKSVTMSKSMPTQLQQLRRTLGASTVSPLALGRKRKPDEVIGSNYGQAPKRFHISPGLTKTGHISSSGSIATRRGSPSQVLNGSRTTSISTESLKRELTSSAIATQEKKLATMERTSSAGSTLHAKALAGARALQQAHRSVATPTAVKTPIGKTTQSNKDSNTQSQSSTRMVPAKPKTELLKQRVSGGKTTTAAAAPPPPSSSEPTLIDDFETMPTFTIVNINDIINKKGDVLISKAPINKRSTGSAGQTPSDLKSKGRNVYQQQSKVLANKISPDRFKNSQAFRSSTPLMKKLNDKLTSTSQQSKLMGRNAISSANTPLPVTKATAKSTDVGKPAPRILNAVVGRRTQPVKPVIADLEGSNDSPNCSLSLIDDDGDVTEDTEKESAESSIDDDLGESKSESGKRPLSRRPRESLGSKIKSSNEPTTATKENSPAATNCLASLSSAAPPSKGELRKISPEKVIVSKQGDKIIKKITCFETWYVINMPVDKPDEHERNTLDMPLINLANMANDIKLPSDIWTAKVTLFELSATALAKSTPTTYTGDIHEQKIAEEDRYKYQPSCVMFRRTVGERVKTQLPYDRAVIFKNKTFFTNIDGKNVRLIGAPLAINEKSEVEALLEIIDSLTLQSPLVEPASTVL